MEKLFGPLGAFAMILGAIMVFDGYSDEGQASMISGVALIVSGMTFLAFYEVIKVMKQIRDNTRKE